MARRHSGWLSSAQTSFLMADAPIRVSPGPLRGRRAKTQPCQSPSTRPGVERAAKIGNRRPARLATVDRAAPATRSGSVRSPRRRRVASRESRPLASSDNRSSCKLCRCACDEPASANTSGRRRSRKRSSADRHSFDRMANVGRDLHKGIQNETAIPACRMRNAQPRHVDYLIGVKDQVEVEGRGPQCSPGVRPARRSRSCRRSSRTNGSRSVSTSATAFVNSPPAFGPTARVRNTELTRVTVTGPSRPKRATAQRKVSSTSPTLPPRAI